MGQRQWRKVITNPDGSRGTELVVEEVPDDVLAAEQNYATILGRMDQALDANAGFLALASPTNAQTLAQVRRLTRECSGLIRLARGRLDSTDDT